MPWKECSVMDERLRFVGRLLDGETMTDVCREFGISRKTGYKIFGRYKEHGHKRFPHGMKFRFLSWIYTTPRWVVLLWVAVTFENVTLGSEESLTVQSKGGDHDDKSTDVSHAARCGQGCHRRRSRRRPRSDQQAGGGSGGLRCHRDRHGLRRHRRDHRTERERQEDAGDRARHFLCDA